jgi:hypothetical protein
MCLTFNPNTFIGLSHFLGGAFSLHFENGLGVSAISVEFPIPIPRNPESMLRNPETYLPLSPLVPLLAHNFTKLTFDNHLLQ